MAIEETPSHEQQPTEVRARRAAVATGVGLVWAFFLASLGLILLAVLTVVAAAVVAVVALGPRLPRYDLRGAAGRAGVWTARRSDAGLRASSVGLARARVSMSAAARTAAAIGQRLSVSAGHAGRIGAARAAAAGRTAGGQTVVATRRLSRDAQRVTRTGISTAVPAVRAAADRTAAAATTTKRRLERPADTQAPSLARESTYLRRQGRVDEAVQVAAAAVAEFDNAGDARGRALAANSLGIALAQAGRHAEAIDAFDTALAVLAEVGDRHHEGQVLANLGSVHQRVGGDEAARFCWSKALERLEPGTPESERTAELLGVR